MREIIPPKQCPSCNSILEWKNDTLYCISTECNSRIEKAIEHWGKELKIKGLGPQTIKKLEISSLLELYMLDEHLLTIALGSEKLASKLFSEIEESKSAGLEQVLPAFGIPLIGSSATQKICSVISSIYDISQESLKEAKLGPKATENLLKWYNEQFIGNLENLPFSFEVERRPARVTAMRGVICITGKLVSFKTKAEAAKVLEEAGYLVKDSVTKDVTHLVNESGVESAKTTKARQSGIVVINNLKQLLEN